MFNTHATTFMLGFEKMVLFGTFFKFDTPISTFDLDKLINKYFKNSKELKKLTK
jgi:hypothetical protein